MLSSLCFKQQQQLNLPAYQNTFPSHCQSAAAEFPARSKTDVSTDPLLPAAEFTADELSRQPLNIRHQCSTGNSLPFLALSLGDECGRHYASVARQSQWRGKKANTIPSCLAEQAFASRLGLPPVYMRISEPISTKEPTQGLITHLQNLLGSRFSYRRLRNESIAPGFQCPSSPINNSDADDDETHTVVTYISLTDHQQASPTPDCSKSTVTKQSILATRVVGGKSPIRRKRDGIRETRHVSWKDVPLDSAGPIGETTEELYRRTSNVYRKRTAAEGVSKTILVGAPVNLTKENLSRNSSCLLSPEKRDKYKVQIQQIKRLLASQRHCHKWFFTLYEFDKPDNPEETVKLETSLFDIIVNRLHWIYALSMHHFLTPERESGVRRETTVVTPDHSMAIPTLSKVALIHRQLDRCLKLRLECLPRMDGDETRIPTTDIVAHSRLRHHASPRARGIHHQQQERQKQLKAMFAYTLLEDFASSSGSCNSSSSSSSSSLVPSPSSSVASSCPAIFLRSKSSASTSIRTMPVAASLHNLNEPSFPKLDNFPTAVTAASSQPTRVSCMNFSMFSRSSPMNPGQLFCTAACKLTSSCGNPAAVDVCSESGIYCYGCGRNITEGSSVASTAGGSGQGAGRTWYPEVMHGRYGSNVNMCYSAARSMEFYTTVMMEHKQTKSQRTTALHGNPEATRMSRSFSYNSPSKHKTERRGNSLIDVLMEDCEQPKTRITERPQKRRRHGPVDTRSNFRRHQNISMDTLHQPNHLGQESEFKEIRRSKKIRHWLHKRLGQQRVEDWLSTSWMAEPVDFS